MAMLGTPSCWCMYKHVHLHPDEDQKNSETIRDKSSFSSFTYMKLRIRSEKNGIMKVSWTDTASDYVTVEFYTLHSEGIY